MYDLAKSSIRTGEQRKWLPTAGHGLSHPILSDTSPSSFGAGSFLGYHSLGYPVGIGSSAIRRAILPNSRLVRWLSASMSQ
jgi:hypothetical protein